MKPNRSRSAFTTTELLTVLGVLFLVGLVLTPALSNARARSRRIDCVCHLKIIGLSMRTWVVDYNGQYPWNVAPTNGGFPLPLPGDPAGVSNNVYFLLAKLSNEISTPNILICPSDSRRPIGNSWASGLSEGADAAKMPSYFIGTSAAEERPESLLGGDRNLLIPALGLDFKTPANYDKIISVRPSDLSATKMAVSGWSSDIHNHAGNILLGDGSVQQTTDRTVRGIFQYLLRGGQTNLDLFFPAL